MSLQSLYDLITEEPERRYEFNKIMNQMSSIIDYIGVNSNSKLYSYGENTIWKNTIVLDPCDHIHVCLFPLIHLLCNQNKSAHYTKIDSLEYTLPFPILSVNENTPLFWKLENHNVEFLFVKDKHHCEDVADILTTKDYVISKKLKGCYELTILNANWKSKSKKEAESIILQNVKEQFKLLEKIHLFYKGLNIMEANIDVPLRWKTVIDLFDCNNMRYSKKDDKNLKAFINLLKDYPEILKIITLFSNIELQKIILGEMAKFNVQMAKNDPIMLLTKLKEQVIDWNNQENAGVVDTGKLEYDLSLLSKKFKDEENMPKFYKLLFKMKLDQELKDNIGQKRHKI